ncbi:TIGR02206 family membrane protein [Chungangia koreensis]|uniref:TIGR02206 family membrane protein n=1 Tax=Chungangia koreensis TaxID=752657 RepID=A0ABV8X2G7_9LACT
MKFVMFSAAHWFAISVIVIAAILLFTMKNRINPHQKWERFVAVTLLIMDLGYHVWLISSNRWRLMDSLPLELCSLSLLAAIVLLWTGNRKLYPFVFFAGIGGALQAVLTPVLDLSYPHFRYFHFFYTHGGIILTALYFTWVKGYRPTFKGVLQTMLTLNLLLPVIFLVNLLVEGNYMFLRMKPVNGSLLDYLGPYPWYLLSLEAVAFLMFSILWLLFRNYKSK